MAKIVRKEKVKLGSLKPYPGNANIGDVPLIKESLDTLDQYRSIVVQESTGFILAGNHTWLAANELGLDGIHAEFVECTDEEARKIVLIDNRAPEKSPGYNDDKLVELLGGLEGDFSGTGFAEDDLTKLLDQLSPKGGDGVSESGFGAEPRVQQGDVWILGPHRLVCGDATELGDLGILLAGDYANLVVTSPPYNQKLDSFKPSGMQKENPAWVERMASAYEDSMPEEEYQDEQVAVLDSLVHVTTENASIFYNHKHRYRDREVLSPMVAWLPRLEHWNLRQEIVWDRQGSITLNAKMFMPCDERIYWLTCGDSFVFNDTPEVKGWSSVWDIAPRAEVQVSAPYPIELPSRAIQACSMRGDIVLDPYGGSGTTLIACENLGRRGFMLERNPAYCDVIIARYESMSGITAKIEE